LDGALQKSHCHTFKSVHMSQQHRTLRSCLSHQVVFIPCRDHSRLRTENAQEEEFWLLSLQDSNDNRFYTYEELFEDMFITIPKLCTDQMTNPATWCYRGMRKPTPRSSQKCSCQDFCNNFTELCCTFYFRVWQITELSKAHVH